MQLQAVARRRRRSQGILPGGEEPASLSFLSCGQSIMLYNIKSHKKREPASVPVPAALVVLAPRIQAITRSGRQFKQVRAFQLPRPGGAMIGPDVTVMVPRAEKNYQRPQAVPIVFNVFPKPPIRKPAATIEGACMLFG